jgi:protein-S-isoprenylcysteine O-methyltransferase Ste14
MSIESAHKRRWQIFEVIVGVPFLAGIGLRVVVPVSLPNWVSAPVIMLAGAALVITGLTFIVLARRELARHGQPTDPGLPTSRLVTTGVFSVSRNPIYFGGVCLLAGIALVFSLTWSLLLLVPATAACHYLLIAPEERYLVARFDMEYTKYTASVRRWLGRKRG